MDASKYPFQSLYHTTYHNIMRTLSEIKKSALVSLWFMFLTFPIMVIRVNTTEKLVLWRWENMVYVGIGSFLLSFVWRYLLWRKEIGKKVAETGSDDAPSLYQRVLSDRRYAIPAFVAGIGLVVIFPFVMDTYQTNIMITALMYIVLGLGLNIVVGLAGLLDLGYVAFYAVGAYTYGLLNHHFGLGFWIVLPMGAMMGAFFGILLGFPVLRLRGDYLAIVTLGFGEIIRLILENWNEFSYGPSGIAHISRPSLFGLQLSLSSSIIYLYFIMIGMVVFTIFVVNRLQNSRIGRAWIALREDEVACQAMGIDKTRTKLTAFALGATWAGMVGVIFAAKTTFINPASFTFLESAMILAIVVLGGMGSILGVAIAALILILLPEYLRAFSDYRMLIFGAIMVLMMVFRPQGIVANVRRSYKFQPDKHS
jgi:branched-chain amino acid transport system permease protein